MTEPDYVILEGVGYTSDADLEYNDDGSIANHDEVVNNGNTFYEARAISPETAEQVADSMIVKPEDDGWKDQYDDLDVGDAIRLQE